MSEEVANEVVKPWGSCPYEGDETVYDVRMVTGVKLIGRFEPMSVPRAFWTLVPEDGSEDGWLDVNPAHIVAIAPSETVLVPARSLRV